MLALAVARVLGLAVATVGGGSRACVLALVASCARRRASPLPLPRCLPTACRRSRATRLPRCL
eukprot:11411219-Alexandrium_andersonii.AAC.1